VPLLKFYYNPLFSVHWLNERIYLILTYLILLLKHKISLSLNVASINISVHVDCCSHLAACTQSLYVVTRLHSQQSRLQDINILRSKINSSPIRIILSLESTSWFISLGTKAPFAPSASRRRDHIWPTCKIVMYAYSSSCQIHHCQLRVYDGISTGVVWWWSLIATRTFWPLIVIRSPIAYMYSLNWHRSFDVCKLLDARRVVDTRQRGRCECLLYYL